jgi:hypothetical protein
MLNWRKFLLQVAVLVISVMGVLFACLPSASADGPGAPAPVTDSFFREEAPERMVECADNVFVPLGEGGTWECPHPAEPDADDPRLGQQLPEEVIGRQVDCPDGSVGRVIDVEFNTTCDELESPSAATTVFGDEFRLSSSQMTLAAMGLIFTAAGTLYMIYRKQPGQ